MKEIPLLFTGPMVRAILDGRKTMTRRIRFAGQPGDRIWVRETYTTADRIWDDDRAEAFMSPALAQGVDFFRYRADGEIDGARWRPSIFMPRWASRIILEVLDVREERLQNITEEDAVSEGTAYYLASGGKQAEEMSMRAQFGVLWNSINAERGYGWATNPPVKVVSFRRIKS